ncbi:MAG: hypothetical protein ACTSXG_04395, partial [Alphaproteobacteria bacterium]
MAYCTFILLLCFSFSGNYASEKIDKNLNDKNLKRHYKSSFSCTEEQNPGDLIRKNVKSLDPAFGSKIIRDIIKMQKIPVWRHTDIKNLIDYNPESQLIASFDPLKGAIAILQVYSQSTKRVRTFDLRNFKINQQFEISDFGAIDKLQWLSKDFLLLTTVSRSKGNNSFIIDVYNELLHNFIKGRFISEMLLKDSRRAVLFEFENKDVKSLEFSCLDSLPSCSFIRPIDPCCKIMDYNEGMLVIKSPDEMFFSELEDDISYKISDIFEDKNRSITNVKLDGASNKIFYLSHDKNDPDKCLPFSFDLQTKTESSLLDESKLPSDVLSLDLVKNEKGNNVGIIYDVYEKGIRQSLFSPFKEDCEETKKLITLLGANLNKLQNKEKQKQIIISKVIQEDSQWKILYSTRKHPFDNAFWLYDSAKLFSTAGRCSFPLTVKKNMTNKEVLEIPTTEGFVTGYLTKPSLKANKTAVILHGGPALR